MLYDTLYNKAKALVEKEREDYALDKLTNLMTKINQQEMIIKHTQKVLKDLEDDLKDLCTRKVGHPSIAWRIKTPGRGILTNIS